MPKVICGCGKTVETKPEWAGQWISCPGCGGTLYAPFPGEKPGPPVPVLEIVPSTPAAPAAPASVAPATRICPWCAETISATATVCPMCKGDAAARPGARPGATAVLAGPPSDTGGMAPLILGILGFVFCPLFAPAAWVIGSGYEKDCRARGFEPSGAGRVGKILGIIGSVFLILGLLFMGFGILASSVSP
jgi:hypothetical protein